MALKTKVKAGNITNLSDARYCAGMGVDWLGFPADVVNPDTFKEITDWVTGPQFVLELTSSTSLNSIPQYEVTTLEIPSDQLHLIDQVPSMSWMVTLPLSAWASLKNDLLKYATKISHLVVEMDGTDLQHLKESAAHFKILINQSEHYPIVQLLSLPIEGINVIGENELRPGLKDFERLSSVLEDLEVLD
jgi:phosphoribosylanthranilate isomerase